MSTRPRRRPHHARYATRSKRTQLPRILVRINIASAVLVLLIVTATLGFHAMGSRATTWSDAFYMTLITITTVGYGEVVPLVGFWDRLFAGLVALGGFGTVTFLFTSLSVFFLEGDLDYTLRRRRMEKQIHKLHGHFIVCGFGRVGRNVAQELINTNRHFVAIDVEEAHLEQMKDKLPGLLYLAGDASDEDLLHAAFIEDARGIFAVTGDDSRNLMITLTAKQINPHLRIVARSNDVRNSDKMRKAGADAVVSPDFTGGMRIASAMIRPHVVTFLDEMLRSDHRLRVEEVVVPDTFESRSIEALRLAGPDYILLAVRTNGDWLFNPPGDFVLKPGHTLVAMTSPHGRQQLEMAMLPLVDQEV